MPLTLPQQTIAASTDTVGESFELNFSAAQETETLTRTAKPEGQPYACDLVFLRATQASASTLGEWLLDPLAPFTRDGGHGGIALIWDTKIRTSTFVDELMGYSRLSEWDYLSDLGDVAEAYGRFPPSPPPIPEDV